MSSKVIAANSLNTGFTVLEKIIAIIIAAGSLIILYYEVSLVADFITSGIAKTGKTSYGELIKVHHLPLIVSVLGVFGGCMLLFNDKKGWILSLIATAMFGMIFLISSRTNAIGGSLTYAGFYKSYGITAIASFIMFILLLLNPFRQKYAPTAKNWAWIFGAIILLLADKLIF